MTPEKIEQERTKFEKNIPESGITNYKQRLKSGEYAYDHIKFAWEMWQARAQQSAWISVDDRLPELNKEVLVAWTDGVVGRARHINDESEKQTWDIYSSYEQIAYWQPLPEPPQDNTNGSAQ